MALLRDPTRGGLGTVLKEMAVQGNVGIAVEENTIPIHDEVKAVCSILGYDPLYLANEGKVVMIVNSEVTEQVLSILHSFEEGREAAVIGKTLGKNQGKVGLKTAVGGIRLIDELGEDQVPRIC